MLSTISASSKNSVFDVVFPDEAALNQMASTIALVFAPGLLQVLQSTVPPTIEYFKTLPPCDRLDRFWAVYLLVLEKPGHKANLRKAKHNKSNQDSIDKLRTAKKYWCDLCKVSKASKYKLDQHNATPSHLRKVADMVDPKKPHKCVPCNMSFHNTGHFYRHEKSVKHKATVSKILRRKS